MRATGCSDDPPCNSTDTLTVDTCVIGLGSQFALVNKSQLPTICLTILTLKSAQVSVLLANYPAITKYTGTKHAHTSNFNAFYFPVTVNVCSKRLHSVVS